MAGIGNGRVLDLWSRVESAYQPIVELAHRTTVGYEALARWPVDPGVVPGDAFAAAQASGTLKALDAAAQSAALAGAHDAHLPESYTLFVNVEVDAAPELTVRRALARYTDLPFTPRVVVELTERALLVDPGRVMSIVDTIRSLGCGVALDDVGSTPDSLIMLEFVAPDFIKVDRDIVQASSLTQAQASTVNAITGYVEAFPETRIVAEGIETAAHLEQAVALGATHGQGWLFGHPSALPVDFDALGPDRVAFTGSTHRMHVDDADLTSILEDTPTRVARRDVLIALSRHLEDAASALDEPLIVLAAFQSADNFTPAVARRYSALASSHRHCFIGVLGIDMPVEPAPQVRTVSIDADELLAGAWLLTILSPSSSAAIIARIEHEDSDQANPQYRYLLTHDRRTVTRAARALMRRMTRGEST